ncbi:MAG: response regulator [Aggregatilineales bacterium]
MSYILLVEDNQDNADLVIRALQGAGFQVQHTTRGLTAAGIVRKERPDLILMDFDLPDIDGRNMVLLLRSRLGGKLAPPIIAVTARVSDLEMRIAERLGCAAFIGKPFLPDELISVIKEVLRSAPQNR